MSPLVVLPRAAEWGVGADREVGVAVRRGRLGRGPSRRRARRRSWASAGQGAAGCGVDGITRLHELIAAHVPEDAEPGQVVVGIETDRGPWVQALLASGYQVYAINPMQAARYRERHSTSGAKSDAGDAHVLAELVRLDRAAHRPIAGDSDLAEAIKLVARAHRP